MKKNSVIITLLFFALLTISLFGCDFKSKGVITGYDARECACCGGYFIEIDSVTYRFYDLPENSDIDLLNSSFPLNVQLDWEKNPSGCMGDEILISRIKLE